FPLGDEGHLSVATTRPELLYACVTVAVNPQDERYKEYVGRKIKVPLSDREVEIKAGDMVDPEFGTGVVMICTYGDKADVKFVQKNRLPATMILDAKGKLTAEAGRYEGLKVAEAKKAIANDLANAGFLEKIDPITQEVGTCWRCHTPIEILERKQWFMKTLQLRDEIIKNANSVEWHPDYARNRLVDWTESLDWDWVISRQRIFATPIPAWYCKGCGTPVLAEEGSLPVDPKTSEPRKGECPKCGKTAGFVPETDVFDTWMDSSITCAVHAGWPDKPENVWRRLFPADLHPSGVDIIRTWAYYLMARHLALFNEKPYKRCLINGMVLGTDGRMMHKSLGNYVATTEVFQKYGADASRQWAASGGSTGSDIPFRWPDVKYAWRFQIKLWNASRFVSLLLKDYAPAEASTLGLLDKWLLARMNKATAKCTLGLERYQFNFVMEEIRNFTWRDFCDNYIESTKHRLYKANVFGEENREAAQYTLYTALYRILQLFAPIAPHITEEIYQATFAKDKGHKSIHQSPWPPVRAEEVDEKAIENGDLVLALIGEIRREKARRKLPLNASVAELKVYANTPENAEVFTESAQDIIGTCKIERLTVLPQKGLGVEVRGYTGISFTGL
ncbi:MAG: class I tRNA ligase family protein, partial [Candidatus Bathyarchaeota archaeon]|nr:class I tRNA ligase family protein [Candidatus Bathyarchaeota archaeon]